MRVHLRRLCGQGMHQLLSDAILHNGDRPLTFFTSALLTYAYAVVLLTTDSCDSDCESATAVQSGNTNDSCAEEEESTANVTIESVNAIVSTFGALGLD